MKKFIRWLLLKPVLKLAEKFASRPDKNRVHNALTGLYSSICNGELKKGPLIQFSSTQRYVILSDQHKGAKNGSDDFAFSANNYLKALQYYNNNNYHFISLGDCEELWENSITSVKENNIETFKSEKLFLERNAFTKVFGNHDLYWDNDPFAGVELEKIYGLKIPVFEGVVLRIAGENTPLDIFLTHGHQGDVLSDGNWFSKWFVANIWAPLQSYLSINPNTPAYEDHLKTDHNRFMYEWVAQKKNILLITGHTHQPVFQSLTLLEKLYQQLAAARAANDEINIKKIEAEIFKKKLKGEVLPDFSGYQPSYFNSGCCCFSDGDITGIEISDGMIRLIKWEYEMDNIEKSERILLEESPLSSFAN